MKPTGNRTVLILDSPATRRFRELRAPHAVRLVRGWDALHGLLRDAPASTLALVDPYADAKGRTLAPELRELMARCPMTPVVAALPFSPARQMEHVALLLEWGVCALVDLDLEKRPEAIVQHLNAAHARPLKRRLEPALSRYVPVNAVTLLRRAAEVVADGTGAAEMALSFGVRPGTLKAWCDRAALPVPRRLLAWTRVLLAAALAEDGERTLAGVARTCGYTSDRSLRRAVRLLAGPDSADTPRHLQFAAAMAAFNAELRGLREALRERERASRVTRAGARG